MKAIKGVMRADGYWRVSVHWQGKHLHARFSWRLHGGKQRAVMRANRCSRAFHAQLGKPLRAYVLTVARASTGHIGVHEVKNGWMLMVRGRGRPEIRRFVSRRRGIRYAVALRRKLFQQFHRGEPEPAAIPRRAVATNQ